MKDHGNDPGHNVHNQPTITLDQRIDAVKAYVRGLPSVAPLHDDELYKACVSALDELRGDLSVFPEVEQLIKHWETEVVPVLAVDYWRTKFSEVVRIPIEQRLKSSGLDWTQTDIETIEKTFWEKMIGPGILHGHVKSLGRNMELLENKTSIRISGIPECACSSVCKCHKKSHLNKAHTLAGIFFRLSKKAAETWRNQHRKRDQAQSNARAKTKRQAVKEGIEYVSPERMRLQATADTVWSRIAATYLPHTENVDAALVKEPEGYKGRAWEFKGKGETRRNKTRKQKAAKQFYKSLGISACPGKRGRGLTHRIVFGKPNPEVTAALEDWKRLPHDVKSLTRDEWDDLFLPDGRPKNPIVNFDPRQRTLDELIATTWGNETRYLYHRELGRVGFINRCSDGTTWVEVDKQRIQLVTADLSESKWPKPTKVVETDALAVV